MSIADSATAAAGGLPASASTCEVCGWFAAFASALAFGTFGVPIKSKAAVAVDIDPLVFQSYKTSVCFLTAWLVLLSGEIGEFTFSPWGIVSGLFWVPGGVATVYAVKSAGLALGIGIGSSFIVLVSFVWGIFIFDERVHSRWGACFAILCLMTGLFGMSYYSAPEETATAVAIIGDDEDEGDESETILREPTKAAKRVSGGRRYEGVSGNDGVEGEVEAEDDDRRDEQQQGLQQRQQQHQQELPISSGLDSVESKLKATERTLPSFCSDASSDDQSDGRAAEERSDESPSPSSTVGGDRDSTTSSSWGANYCFNVLTRRQRGMLSAAFCGLWGGSIMVPMKWSKSDDKGVHYLLSFAIGAAIVTVGLWAVRFLALTVRYRGSVRLAYEQLPSFHLRVMWLPGGLSGLLWSIGNFFSLFSVYYLGEGVGYPLVQTAILVSGLWGIFYFKEVTGRDKIVKWLASSLLTIFGIILLSYEHHEK